jgi:hypothetical protein
MIKSADRAAGSRVALAPKFLDQAGGDAVTAEPLRRAHYVRLARLSATARRAAEFDGWNGGEPEER